MLGPLEDALGDREAAARGRQRERLELGAPQQPPPAQAGQHAARLLAHRGRARAGRASSPPTWPRSRPSWRARFRSAVGARRARADGRLPAARRAGLRRPRHVGEDRPQPALQRAQVHVRGRHRGARCARDGDARRARRCSDTGVGIPAARAAAPLRALPPRARTRTARTPRGHAASAWRWCRSWSRLHGGTVDVESALGQGTTFTVALPRGTRAPAAGAASPPRRAPGRRRPTRRAYVEEALRWLPGDRRGAGAADGRRAVPAPTRAARVLVADDNADMRDYLARLLGARWRRRGRGRRRGRARRRSRASAPDLVLTDVMMPRLDGFGLLRGAARRRAHLRRSR